MRPSSALILVGFMGAGKTTIGRSLAQYLGWGFEDLDDRIQACEGRTIPEIFEVSGESAFRAVECRVLKDCLSEIQQRACAGKILALGGGAFVQLGNQALIAAAGLPVVFLDASVEELWQRCAEQNLERPLRGDFEEFRQLWASRRPYYLRASLRVETGGKAIETIVAEIASALKLS